MMTTKVKLNENNNPVAWGEKLVGGDDIPEPPDRLTEPWDKRPKWDDENEQWVEDPDFEPEPGPEHIDRAKISGDTRDKIIEARAAGNYEKALDHVLDILDVIELEENDG